MPSIFFFIVMPSPLFAWAPLQKSPALFVKALSQTGPAKNPCERALQNRASAKEPCKKRQHARASARADKGSLSKNPCF